MDFKRVEGIFLVVFLFLNMFLFYVYQEGKTEQKTVSTGTISENIEERLRADDIKVPHSLSEKIHQGYYLSAEEGQFFQDAKEQLKNQEWQVNDAQLTSQLFSKTDTVIDSDNGEKEVEDFITKKGNVLYSDEYKYSTFESQKDTKYMFHQEWEGLPVYDETSQLSVNLQKDNVEVATIDSYEQTYITNIEALRDPQKLISEREAIISLYTNNRLQSGNKIKWIELGYTRIFTVREKNVYIPAWFVAVESNKNNIQIEKVNAFSSAIISSNVSEVKN
ncbi:two-component system regulatory protein YycI [Vagococcus fluvialis]|uniref:two-component system regulatory protein YycI n=1 Tax=Vagococcus fluvialis TaxID=2738 RepID=UPI003B598C3E